MNPQVALSFPAGYVGRTAWAQQIDALRAAVKHLGPKEVAFELDVGGSHLADALNERDRKVWHASWTHTVKAMLGNKRDDEIAADLLRALCDSDLTATPFVLTDDVALSPEEEAVALRRELLRFGDAGKAAVDRIKRRKR